MSVAAPAPGRPLVPRARLRRRATRALLRCLASAGAGLRHTPLARSGLLNRVLAEVGLWLHGSNETQVGPFRVRFDPRDRVMAKKLVLYGEWERHEVSLMCSLLRPGDHVLDIGANIGLHSLHFSRAVGPAGRVVAVEPDPDNLALLAANLEANGCRNVTVLPYAFGTESRPVELFQVHDDRGRLSLADIRGTRRSVRVEMRRGEEALRGLQVRPAAAKIDVEGAEPLVLAGLGRYQPDVLMFEFAQPYLRAMGHDPEAFLTTLLAEGYTLERIHPQHGGRLPAVPSELLAGGPSTEQIYNLLARRRPAAPGPAR